MLIPFGEKDGDLVHVSMVEKGFKCECICPECKVPLIARKGPYKIHHFAHKGGSNCKGETLLHTCGKRIIQDRLVRALSTHQSLPMEWKCNECPDQHEGNLIRSGHSVELEYSFGVCRPDLTLFDKDKKPVVFIEIVVSHQPGQNVYSYAEEHSIRIVEILISSPDDLEKLASDEPIRPASVNVCTRPKCGKCASSLSRQYLHVVSGSCWKCDNEMKFALIDQEHATIGPEEFSQEQARIASEHGALLKEKYNRNLRGRYLSNTCPNCNVINLYFYHNYDYWQRKTGIPVGHTCGNCREQEVRAKRSTYYEPISIKLGDEWLEVDIRPSQGEDDVGSEE